MLLLPLGCGGEPPADSAAPGDSGGETVDWSAPSVEPVYGVVDLDGAIADVLEHHVVHPLTIESWFAAVVDDLAGGGQACPGPNRVSETKADTELQDWFGDCAGAEYTVHGGWIVEMTSSQANDQLTKTVVGLFSFTGEHNQAGAPLAAGGKVYTQTITQAGVTQFELMLSGGFLDSESPTALAEGVAVSVDWEGGYQAEGGVKGTFDGPIGGGASALVLDEVGLDPMIGAGATGTVYVRDPSSGWWTISLADDSSGCGSVSWAGTEMGESCAGVALAASLNALFIDGMAGL